MTGAPGRPLLLWLLVGLALSLGCGSDGAGQDGGQAGGEPSDLVIFVYDRSASMSDYQLELARTLTGGRINALGHGDRVAALEMLQHSLSEPPKRWTQPVPAAEFPGEEVYSDSVRLARFQRDARDYLRRFTEPEGRNNIRGTDIFSTLHDVASVVQAYPQMRPIVYIFSDMLQSTGPIEMEGLRSMPSPNWVQRQQRDGQLPDLGGACIFVVGARVDNTAGQRVLSFWEEYFQAANARLDEENYTLRPVRLPVRPCP